MSLEFNTNGFDRGNRLELWRDVICRNQMPISPECHSAAEFDAQIRIRDWADVQISDATFSPVNYRRGATEIRQTEGDYFLYVLYDRGFCSFDTPSQSIGCHAGDLLIYDASQPFSLRFPDSGYTITVRIPRPLFLKRIPQADRQFALHICGKSPMAQLSAGLLRNIATLSSTPSAQPKEAAHSLIDMLCIAVRERMGDEILITPGQAATLKRIKQNLLAQLGDENLCVENIAKAEGISPRTLNRMFAAEGTTVMKWLWKQRLAASYQAMSRGEVRQVTEAAFSFGFKDCSHFARAFHKEYKIQPRKLLYQS